LHQAPQHNSFGARAIKERAREFTEKKQCT
jgi:hypothetical protein